MARSQLQELKHVIRKIINDQRVGTQAELAACLLEQGFEISQSKLSRLLRLLGVGKQNLNGQLVYQLPDQEEHLPTPDSPISDLVTDIRHNEQLIVILTSPGAAQIIARQLDARHDSLGILGVVAGDDTLFIAPASTRELDACQQAIRQLLMRIDHRDCFH